LFIYRITQDSLIETTYESFIKDDTNKYWLILTPDELSEKNEQFHFSYQTVYDCTNNADVSKLEVYETYNFGILNMIDVSGKFFKIEELDFYLTKNFLVFVSKNYLNLFNEIMNDIYNKGALSLSLEKILYILLDKMTIKDHNMLSNLESEITEVEVDVIEGKTKDYITDIVSLKNRLLFLKKHYEPLLDTIEDLTENENKVLNEKSVAYFIILFNRIERLNKKVGNLRDYVTQIRESYQAQLDINSNNIMKVFTVITAVFLPLTLLVGWYGMNFPNMPEYQWKYGYLSVILLSVLVIALSLWLFKKKKFW